jgi:hypothetical protein
MMLPLYLIELVLINANLLRTNIFRLEPMNQYCTRLKCLSYSVTQVKTQ